MEENMALHDLLHRSEEPQKPEPTVTQSPAQSNTGNETDLKAQINDQQRQIQELIAVRKDLREKVEELAETAAKFRRESEKQEAWAAAAELRVKAEADEVQRLQDALDDNEDPVLKAQIESLEQQVREAQAAARARDEDYRRERREKEDAIEALKVFRETSAEYAEPYDDAVARRYRVEICPEPSSLAPGESFVPQAYVEYFEADEVQVAQGVGHIFFFKAGTLVGGVAHNEWKSLREIESDGDNEPDV